MGHDPRRISICLVLFFTLAGCTGGGAAPTPTMVPTPIVAEKPTYTVQRGAVTKSLELIGRVVPVQQQELFFRSDGFVKAVYYQRGEAVSAGDVLAELETGDLDIQRAEAELALRVAETRLIQARQENADALIEARLALERTNLEALQSGALGVVDSLVEAGANVRRAEEKFKTAEALYQDVQDDPGVSAFNKEKAQAAYEEARRQWLNAIALLEAEENLVASQEAMETARDAYTEAQLDPALTDDEKTAAFEGFETVTAAYVDAWTAYAQALGGRYPLGYAARKAGMDAALAKMRVEKFLRGVDPMLVLDVERVRLSLQKVEERVSNARLVAPFDSVIISSGLAAGSQTTAFRAVMTLADPSSLEITAIPTPEELVDVGVGMAAEARLSIQPGKTYAAQVRSLPILSIEGAARQVSGDQAVHFSLDDPSVALTLGEAATVVIQIEVRQDVLWLPPAALRTFQGQDFVFVESAGVQRRVNVRLGLQSSDRVEILEGLEEGQVIVGP
jgi:HlyD family secretion protein